MNLAKVQPININYIEEYYNLYLSGFSDNTAKNYKCDLDLFFDKMFGKEAKHITVSDLESLNTLKVAQYVNWMKESVISNKGKKKQRYADSSINRKVNSVKGFFEYIATDFPTINKDAFNKVNLPKANTSNSWDSLDWTEAIEIWEYAEDNFKDGVQLSMLFKIATITSIRLDALLQSTWEDNWFVKKERGLDVHYIEVMDKGSKNKKPISEQFYKEIQTKLGSKGKLFPNLYPNKVGDALRECVKAVGIHESRRIVFHSFKKTGIMRALEQTGSMYKAKEQGNHQSIATSEKYYLKYKECLVDMPSYNMDSTVDLDSELSGFSKEELLGALNKLTDSSKFELMRILKG